MEDNNGQYKRSQAKQMEAIQNVAGAQIESTTLQEGRVSGGIRRASSGSISSNKKDGIEVRLNTCLPFFWHVNLI